MDLSFGKRRRGYAICSRFVPFFFVGILFSVKSQRHEILKE